MTPKRGRDILDQQFYVGRRAELAFVPRRVQLQLTENNGIGNQGPAEPTADICNSVSGNNKFGLVEEFIAEFEGVRKDYE